MLSVVTAVRDLGRLREISTVLVRHGFGEIVSRAGFGRARRARSDGRVSLSAPPPEGEEGAPEIDSAEVERGEQERRAVSLEERARLVLQELGPSFIKLGQIASTRPDVLPAPLIAELKKLQDDVPPVPFADIRRVLEASLGLGVGELYASFDERPLATASIGQVHKAVLRTSDGDKPVVVKVQRPGASETVARDLELLHLMAAAVERAIPETKIYSPVALVQQFDRSITAEMNYLVEAENAERFGRNFEGFANVAFPKIYRQLTSKSVLTMELFDGVKVDRAVQAGYDGSIIAKKSVAIIIKMVFEDGFFHADPHPGNIIIMGPKEEPIIGLIDLGMVGRLSPELRDRTIDLLLAAARRDSYAVADALAAIGRPTRKFDQRAYRAEVALLAEKYIGRSMKEIEVTAMFKDIVDGAVKYGIEVPPDFMMVAKSLMTIEGIGKQLDPDLDILGEAQPHFVRLLRQRYSPERLGNEIWRGVEQLSRVGYDLPMQIREVLDDLRLGRMTVRATDPLVPQVADRLGRRVLSGLVIGSLILSGAYLVGADRHATLGIVMFVVAGMAWLLHVLLDLGRGSKQP